MGGWRGGRTVVGTISITWMRRSGGILCGGTHGELPTPPEPLYHSQTVEAEHGEQHLGRVREACLCAKSAPRSSIPPPTAPRWLYNVRTPTCHVNTLQNCP